MRKKTITIISVVLVIMLLFPIRMNLKDGGSVRYKAILYEATKIHKLADVEGIKPYIDGFELKILGMRVYMTIRSEETMEYNGKAVLLKELSFETIEWLIWYNSLSEKEQLSISSIPNDLYKLCGYSVGDADAVAETKESAEIR